MTQIEYIAILFDDCGFDGAQRRGWLAREYRGHRYADELSAAERHEVIERLKQLKAALKESTAPRAAEAQTELEF